MRVSIEGLINRLDDLRERLNELFDKLDQEEMEIEDVEEYFQNDDTFNLSIALDVLEQADKLDKALEIVTSILRHTSHIRLGERRNFGEGQKTSYYLIISCGASECEYKLKNKEEYDLLKEVLL